MNSPESFPAGTSPLSRRRLLSSMGMGLGGIALAEMLAGGAQAKAAAATPSGAMQAFDMAPRAKRVIYLFQSGGPSQLDLYDPKPTLVKRSGEQLPESVRGGQRLTGMSGNQSSLPLQGSPFGFTQYGESGAAVSELLPYTAAIADKLCFVRSMHTDAINHGRVADPGPAEHRRLARLRPRLLQRKSALVCRADHQRQRGSAADVALVGGRISPHPASGSAISLRR